MSDNLIDVTIVLSDPELKDEQLQEIVQNLRGELEETEIVQQADLVAVEDAPAGAKSIGGFVLGTIKAVTDLKKFQPLVRSLSNRLFGQTMKIKAEGNGKKLDIEMSRPEDLAIVMPEVEKFING